MTTKRISRRSRHFILLENAWDSFIHFVSSSNQYKTLLDSQELQSLTRVITDFIAWQEMRKGMRKRRKKYEIPPGLNKEAYEALFGEHFSRLRQLKDEYKRQRSMLEMMERSTSPRELNKWRKEMLEPLEKELKRLETEKDYQ
jgi:hypothetical protein